VRKQKDNFWRIIDDRNNLIGKKKFGGWDS
jgi:hypothetical protein